MKALHKAALIGVTLALYSTAASAQLTNQGMLDQVVTEFATRATSWQTVVMNAATWLFWTLGTISLVWTGGMLILRKADIGEFFAEFFRFVMFFGFFLWLLRNGPSFASSIIRSLQQIGEQASGVSSVTPSGIVDIGFMIWKQAITSLSVWTPVDSFVGVVLSAGIMLLLAAVAVNMLLILVSAWILMYAGIFFLGFGGSRWTSDMAINYYKTVLGVAVQLFAMVLLVGIGNDLLSTFYGKMSKGQLNFEELGVMLVFCFALLMLVNKVPGLLSGVITGVGVSESGIGNFGAGAVVGAAGMAAAAAATGGAMIAAGAASAGGGAQALMAAFSKASENVQAGSDVLTSMWGGGGGDNGGGGSGGGSRGDNGGSATGNTPFAQAAGFGSSAGSSFSGARGETSESANPGQAKDQAKNKQEQSRQGESTRETKGNSASSGQLAAGSTSSGLVSAGKIAADAGANLVSGAATVAKEKFTDIKDALAERMGDTTGGKIAAAIKAMGSNDTPTFADNSLSSDRQVDPASEVAAFANRDTKTA